jgi:helix-turn-helix protein
MSESAELPQGLSLFIENGQTLLIERVDDAMSVSLEPVPVLRVHEGIALTGIQHAADYLGLHVNTVRRYADKGFLGVVRSPAGFRRVRVESLKELRSQMYSEV